MTYRTHDIPVDGGSLRVGEWGPGGPDATTVIAVHGITASHLAWAWTAEAIPEVRIVAPDLRGRGRSAGLPGPCGMDRHAADLLAVSNALDLPPATLVGHSMGAFVAVVTASLYPDRFSEVLLIDGGLPLAIPAGVSSHDLLKATLGPAMARLCRTFPDRAAYREFWKRHPAFASDWSEALADFADYDLTGTEPQLRSSCSLDAVTQDSEDLFGGRFVTTLLTGEPETTRPVTLLSAPRGLFDQTPGLYSPSEVERWRRELPVVTIREVPDVNHYTIVMSDAGAGAIAREVRAGKRGARADGRSTERVGGHHEAGMIPDSAENNRDLGPPA